MRKVTYKEKKHFFIPATFISCFLLSLAACAFSVTGNFSSLAYAGPMAPDFELPNLDGEKVSLSQLRGKIVILDFWATWCPPCRKEIPHFIEIQNEYKDKGVEVVGLSLDQGGLRDVAPFAREYGINYTMLLGNQSVAESFGGIRGIPTTFVISRDGEIFKKYVGYRDKAVFEKDINTLLGV